MHSTSIVILFTTQSHKMAIQTSVLDQNYNENKDSIHTLSMRDIIIKITEHNLFMRDIIMFCNPEVLFEKEE